jgi:restriction endonuclease S subunit
MAKVYISGQITGLNFDEAFKNFEDAEKEVKSLGGVPVNPMKLDHKVNADWYDFMEKDISALLRCEGIYMLKMYEKVTGELTEKQQEIVKYLDGLDNKNTLFEYSNNRLFELLLNKTNIYDRIELFNNIENANIDINNNINKLNELNNYKLKIVKYNPTTEIKTLGEVSIIHNGKRIVKNKVDTGEYPVLGGGGFTSFYTNEYSRDGKSCKISREGMSLHNCVMILNQKYYLNSQAFTIISNNDKLINNYLWYYLDSIKEIIYNCGRGAAQKAIDIDEFKLIKIPIPSIEVQEEIIDYCDNNLEIINNLKKTIENNKKMMKELF